MILVTGATGQFGNAAINFLLKKGVKADQIVALVRNEQKAEELKGKGVKIALGDYDDYDSLVHAFEGIDKLLFVSGSDIPNRLSQHKNVVKAAKEAGVNHVVYTSVERKNETSSSPLWVVVDSHLETEKALKESGIHYTILRNNLYMDIVPAFVGENVFDTGVVYLPADQGKVGAVLRTELAEATANILREEGHINKEYNFSNSVAFSYHEVAQILSEISGKSINYISPTPVEYAGTLAEYGVPQEMIGLFSSFAVGQAQGELDRESIVFEQILGRKPTTVNQYLSQVFSS